MNAASLLKYGHLAYFSQPAADRPLYRAIRRQRVSSIVELGVGMGERSRRLVEVALRYRKADCVRYTGVDLFEARPAASPGITLKLAHRQLASLGVKVRLAPGDPLSALSRIANSVCGVDLLVIAADQDRDLLARAWFYVPRMLHAGSLIFSEEVDSRSCQSRFRLLSFDQVAALAGETRHRSLGRAA